MRDSFEAPRQSQTPGSLPPFVVQSARVCCIHSDNTTRVKHRKTHKVMVTLKASEDFFFLPHFKLDQRRRFSLCNLGCSLKYSVKSPQLTFPIISQLLYLIISLTGTRCESSWTYLRRCLKKKRKKKRKIPPPRNPTNTRTHINLAFYFKSFMFSNISSFTSCVFKREERTKKRK